MTILSLLAPAVMVALAPPQAAQPDILRATLRWFEREAPLCVDPDLGRAPFEDIRGGFLEHVDGDRLRLPDRKGRFEAYKAILGNWAAVDGTTLDKATEAQIAAAAIALAEAGPVEPLPTEPVGELDGSGPPSPPARTYGKILAGWLGKGQILRAGNLSGCRSLTLSAVAVHGEFAFVDGGIVAGPLNGAGATYALHRENGVWRMLALRSTWVS